jgi:hypothetical protein
VNSHTQRHGQDAVEHLDEHAHGLNGMPRDVFGLIVALRLLVKQFDARHFLAALWRLDAVSDENASAVDAYGARE